MVTRYGNSNQITDRTQVKLFHFERRGRNSLGHFDICQENNDDRDISNTAPADVENARNDAMIESQNVNELPEHDSSYIRPIAEVNGAVENIYNEPNCCGNSSTCNCNDHCTANSYIHVLPYTNSMHQYRDCQNCIEANFKTKRKCILLSLVILMFCSNVIGVSLVYNSKEQSYKDNCFMCDLLPTLTRDDLAGFNVSWSKDGTCCVKSTAKALILLIKGLPNQKDVEKNYVLLNKLLARKRSAIQVKGLGISKNKIVWKICDMELGHLSYDADGIQISVGGTYSLNSNVRFNKRSCLTRRKLGYHVRAISDKGHTFTLASVEHICYNSTNFKHDLSTQTLFQVPVNHTWKVFIEIPEENKDLLQQYHYHSLNVFEI